MLIESTPADLLARFGVIHLVNINAAAQAFLRKLYHLSPGRFFEALISCIDVWLEGFNFVNDFKPFHRLAT